MKDWKTVQGSWPEKPLAFDTTLSGTTVYQRRNVHQVEVENGDGSKTTLWEYEERELTREEYTQVLLEKHAETEDEITNLQLALAAMFEGGL